MSVARLTLGAIRRREWAQPWSERVPRELLVLGRAYRDAIRLLRAGKGPSHDAAVAWETLYERPASEVSRGILAVLVPGVTAAATSFADLENEAELDRWLREFVQSIAGAINYPEKIPRAVAEQAATSMKKSLPQFRVELRVTLDHVAALAFYRAPLALLLKQARQGDLDALEKLLRINPAMEARPWVRDVIGDAVKSRGTQAVVRLGAAISGGLSLRENKLLEVGALLLLVWPWLGRLTTNQRRRFLKAVGMRNVPDKEALREYERCLGVKDLYAGRTREDERNRSG
jgi:hypothetical protein